MENSKTPIVDHQEVAEKLCDMLRPSGWHNLLKAFLVSDDFGHILHTLAAEVEEGYRFTPKLVQVFRAFMECPVRDLKVVVLGQDPYPHINVADGIAFSCTNTMKKEASLHYIHRAIAKTVYQNQVDAKELSPDLTPLANQGVLLLNTALTTRIGKIGSHVQLWKPFIAYLLDMLNSHGDCLVYVLLGKQAQHMEELIHEKHYVLTASHPASAAYARLHEWDCNDVFNKCNALLQNMEMPAIKW